MKECAVLLMSCRVCDHSALRRFLAFSSAASLSSAICCWARCLIHSRLGPKFSGNSPFAAF